ncbi:hypothetical protein COBT_002107 [Conglomerata obtusa]
MKVIACRMYLPVCLTYSKTSQENVKSMVLKPLINKPQGNKASSTKALLKQTDADDELQLQNMPSHLTMYEDKNVLQMGIPSQYNKCVASGLDEQVKRNLSSKFKNLNMHPVLPSFDSFQSENFDSYGTQRMNNVFSCKQWNDMYRRYSEEPSYKDFKTVNKLFVDEIMKIYEDGDVIIVMGHELWLVPKLIRDKIENVMVGVVCLQNVPNLEMIRTFVDPKIMLESLCKANYIEFQSNEDINRFAFASSIIINSKSEIETTEKYFKGNISYESKDTLIACNKFAIDTNKIQNIMKSNEYAEKVNQLKNKFKNKKIIIAVASQINNCVITDVLMGIEAYLYKYGNGIALLLIEIPEGKTDFETKNENHRMIEYINLNYESSIVTTYYPTEDVLYYSLLSIADVALFLNERQAVNKPSLEFIVTQEKNKGSIIVSKFATFSDDLDYVKVNPKDAIEIADSIFNEFKLDSDKKSKKNEAVFKMIKENTREKWTQNIIEKIKEAHTQNLEATADLSKLKENYKKSKKRLVCLDYDGTLVQLVQNPNEAKPDKDLLELLEKLSSNEKNEVFICTGRGHQNIGEWLTNQKIKIIAEHGHCWRMADNWELDTLKMDWKNSAQQIIQFFVERTPGSNLEIKATALCFHNRQSDVKIREVQRKSLKQNLMKIFNHRQDVSIMDGKCALEIRANSIDKGKALNKIISNNHDFMLFAGDDVTDEDMFKLGVDNEKIYSVLVGNKHSYAKYRVDNVKDMKNLLNELADL